MLALGCTRSRGGEPDFAGFLTAVEPGQGGTVLGTVLVESHADKLVRRVVVTVTKDTSIVKRDGAEMRLLGFAALHLQDQVQVWFAEPVRESQATAKQILVTGHY